MPQAPAIIPGLSRRACRKILQVRTRRVPLAEDVDLDHLARQTVDFCGANLENLINVAALLAGRDGKTEVEMDSLERARDRIVLGNKRDSMMDEEEKRRVMVGGRVSEKLVYGEPSSGADTCLGVSAISRSENVLTVVHAHRCIVINEASCMEQVKVILAVIALRL